MHVHTTCSDGSLTGSQMAELAINKNLDFVCVTDHDAVGAVKEFRNALSGSGISTLNGVELTTTYDNIEIHILGYAFTDDKMQSVENFGSHANEYRTKRDHSIMQQLSKEFSQIDMHEFENYSPDPSLGGFPALNYLEMKGIVDGYPQFASLKANLDIPPLGFVPSEEAVNYLKSIGAFPVLAHPSYHFRGGVMPREMLDAFRAMGIEGIECLSPYNPAKEQFEYYKAYCEEFDMAISAGSDCHGPCLKREMGEPYANDEMCNILERLGK